MSSSLSAEDVVAALAQVSIADTELDEVLALVADLARHALPGADEVSVTLIRGDQPWTPAATGQLARTVDQHQYDAGHGPCLDAAQAGGLLVITDMAEETRWPTFAQRAVVDGVRSSVSVGMPLRQAVDGALNVYSTRRAAFDHETTMLASRLAGYAAVAVSNAVRYADATALAAQMRDAMASRAVIEQAKDMLMLIHGCDADAAFDHLIRASQHSHRKLRDVAADILVRAAAPDPAEPDLAEPAAAEPVAADSAAAEPVAADSAADLPLVADRAPDPAPDRVPGRVPDEASDRAPTRATGPTPDRAPDRAPDEGSDGALDRPSDGASGGHGFGGAAAAD